MSKNQQDIEAGNSKAKQRNNRLSWSDILFRWGMGLAIFLLAIIGGLILIAFWKKSSNKISENSTKLASRDETSSFVPSLNQTENLITPITDEFVVNNYTVNSQSGSAASALINGTGIFVWNSAYQDLTTSNSIYAQQINDRGEKIRAEFQVSPDNNNVQHKPAVTQLLNGNYVVVWIDETDKYIYGQRFNITNIKIGSVFQINSNVLYDVYVPIVKVKRFSNGGFLVIWNNHVNAAGENDDIYGQYYAADGSPIGSNVKMNTLTAGNQSYPDVTVLADDKQIVTWDSSTLGGIGYQAFNANRTVLGSEMNVLYASDQYQWYPAITTLIDDTSVLVWNCQQAQQYVVKICTQLLTSSGQKSGSPFVANNNLLVSAAWPAVVGLDNGNFIVIWAGYSYDDGIHGRRFQSNGIPLTGDILLSENKLGMQRYPLSVFSLANGKFSVSWSKNYAPETNEYDVIGRFFSVEELPPEFVYNNFKIEGSGFNEAITTIIPSYILCHDSDGEDPLIRVEFINVENFWVTCAGNIVPNILQANITSRNGKIHTNSNAIPTAKIRCCDVAGGCTSYANMQAAYNNPNHPPQVIKQISNIPMTIGEFFSQDMTGCIADNIDHDLLRYYVEEAGGEVIKWADLVSRNNSLFYEGTPAPGESSDITFKFCGEEITRVQDANLTTCTSFKGIFANSHTSGSGDDNKSWEIYIPLIGSTMGVGTASFSAVFACVVCNGSFFLGFLGFGIRQKISDHRAVQSAREDNPFEAFVLKQIGKPFEARRFKKREGRSFKHQVRRIARLSGLGIPNNDDTNRIKEVGIRIANAIKKVFDKNSYHHRVRVLIGFSFSFFCCDFYQPFSVGSFIKKNIESILEAMGMTEEEIAEALSQEKFQKPNRTESDVSSSLLASTVELVVQGDEDGFFVPEDEDEMLSSASRMGDGMKVTMTMSQLSAFMRKQPNVSPTEKPVQPVAPDAMTDSLLTQEEKTAQSMLELTEMQHVHK